MAVAMAYKRGTLRLGAFEATVPVAIDGDAVYVPCRYLAEMVLGVSWPSQYRTLTNPDGRYHALLREVPIDAGSGQRMPLALPVGHAALWVAGISPSRVKEQIRDRLEVFAEALCAEAAHLLTRTHFRVIGGKSARVTPVKSQRKGGVVVSGARQYEFSCLECGASHILIEDMDNETVYVILRDQGD